MTATPRAAWIAGLLAADSQLRPGMSADSVALAIEHLVTPATVWCTTVPSEEGWDAFNQAVAAPPAAWQAPDRALVESMPDSLEAGWSHISRLLNRPMHIEPVLRVITHTIDDAQALEALGPVDDLSVSSFIPKSFGRWTWRWPLRVGVLSDAGPLLVETITGTGEYLEHYDVTELRPSDDRSIDILVVDPSATVATLDLDAIGAVIVLGSGANPVTAGFDVGLSLGAGAVVALPDRDLTWFETMVRELSHDRPLDAAVRCARDHAVVLGDPDFIVTTSLRGWARQIARLADDRGDRELAEELVRIIGHRSFDREVRGGREITHVIRAAETGGPPIAIVGSPGTRAARPDTPSPGGSPRSTPSDGEIANRPDDARHTRAGKPGALAPRDDKGPGRRLVSKVMDASGNVVDTGFIGGRVHRLRLRIAARAAPGETAANRPLDSPNPDADIRLNVVVHVDRSNEPLPPVSIEYPATGDGEWTDPISFTAPRRSGDLKLFITVLWKGRVVQSATLSGPLTTEHGDRSGTMTLVVDESAGLDDPDRRGGADATLVQVPGTEDEPVLIDASSAVTLDPENLARANRQVRKSLISAFMNPPPSLAEASAVLEDLAIRGALLRDALKGKQATFFDDAAWIHVTSFGGPPVHFELIYTHPMPRTRPVEVCGPALAGNSQCSQDCPDRARDDRVCPFGFWGTSKIVERRLHSPDRSDSSTSEDRIITVRRGSAVGVTDVANVDDPEAGQRIVDAIGAVVDPGTAAVATNWVQLAEVLTTERDLVCLVTHTIEPEDPDDDLGIELQLGDQTEKLYLVDDRYINPGRRHPGPLVLALGCDTGTISASFATFVSRLHSLGAEVVVTAISQIPGKEAADFVERFAAHLDRRLQQDGEVRFGEVLTAARAETIGRGDVMGLALTASGDGDVRLGGRA